MVFHCVSKSIQPNNGSPIDYWAIIHLLHWCQRSVSCGSQNSSWIMPQSRFHNLRSAITGKPHSHNKSYKSPTIMWRFLAMKVRAASSGFRVRLSRKRTSCGVRPSASATNFHSSPPTTNTQNQTFNSVIKNKSRTQKPFHPTKWSFHWTTETQKREKKLLEFTPYLLYFSKFKWLGYRLVAPNGIMRTQIPICMNCIHQI